MKSINFTIDIPYRLYQHFNLNFYLIIGKNEFQVSPLNYFCLNNPPIESMRKLIVDTLVSYDKDKK